MPLENLENAIIDVLHLTGRPTSVVEIVNLITQHDLWRRPSDNKHPHYNQIYARLGNRRDLFSWEDGVVSLLNAYNTVDRMFRLTWNTNDWQTPIKHTWKPKHQGNTNIAFENQYGFGGEEWLFNTRYQKDGYQYGYIRGANELNGGMVPIKNAYLFTINQETKERYLVGQIKSMEIINRFTQKYFIAKRLFEKFQDDFLDEIDVAEGDRRGFDSEEFTGNVRFKFTGQELFNQPILIPGLNGRKYNRFKPYHVNSDLLKILNGHLPTADFIFNPGIARNTNGFMRHTQPSGISINRHHSSITNALKHFLKPEFSEIKKNLSIEKTSFGPNTADIVLLHNKNEISIIEAKTSGITRKNVREALGQLIDYAFWFDKVVIRALIIVSPTPLSLQENDLLQRFQQHFQLKIEYWQYLENVNGSQPPFLKLIS